eukprot:TRINITY_DN29477_c0_g1_i1.p1 TRINITY_DN29477_c0_g1~~TRINITY_DN29477_c0_g1_i1.p1  ORF type:complete len:331 (+),score=82.35 TRINITY_DN29477_c0_g1_i1:66-1058(+)
MSFLALAIVVLAAQFVPGSSKYFLSRSASGLTAQAVDSAKQRLHARAHELAAALGAELHSASVEQQPLVVAAARDLLSREAARLQDPLVAPFLRQYALYAPAAVLVVPVASLGAPRDSSESSEAAPSRRRGESSSYSEETVIKTDGRGNVEKRTVLCENGKCSEKAERGLGNKSSASVGAPGNASSMEFEQRLGGAAAQEQRHAAFESSVARSLQGLADEMRQLHESFGHDGFSSIFNDMLGPSAARDDERLAVGAASGAQDYETTSSETIVENGHVVQVTKTCRNGKCVTSRKESNVQDGGDGKHAKKAPQESVPLQKHPIFTDISGPL